VLLVAWLCLLLVRAAVLRLRPEAGALPFPARFGLWLIPLSAVLNALWARAGATVLFRLPAWLPVIGGGVTLEALAYGALNGLMLMTLLTAFGVLNAALSARDLLSLVPRAFYPLAIIIGIALSYVPATLRQAREIRDAQALRGTRSGAGRSHGGARIRGPCRTNSAGCRVGMDGAGRSAQRVRRVVAAADAALADCGLGHGAGRPDPGRAGRLPTGAPRAAQYPPAARMDRSGCCGACLLPPAHRAGDGAAAGWCDMGILSISSVDSARI
jgi:hypothetical protein